MFLMRFAAHRTAVNDSPLPVFAHPHADGLHDAVARGCAVAGLVIHMDARKAVRAMVAVVAACALGQNFAPADLARERV